MNRLFLLFGLVTFLSSHVCAQVNKEYIRQNLDEEALMQLADRFDREYRDLLRTAEEKGWPTENLFGMDAQGEPIYVRPDNSTAAVMTKTTELRDLRGVFGSGMNIGMWEARESSSGKYAARATHQDLTGRVTNVDADSDPSSHGTHVAGTLIGNGSGNSDAKGMAPQATLHAYDISNDRSEMTSAALDGLLVSNHSYGVTGGWSSDGIFVSPCPPFVVQAWTWLGGATQFSASGDDPNFGRYDQSAYEYDTLCRGAPHYLPVFSAGNNHEAGPHFDLLSPVCSDFVRYKISGGANPTYSSWELYGITSHPVGNSSQISTMTTYKNAKNVLSVGNLEDDESINSSSSRGMTDDGRIKPDICGNGTSVESTESGSDDDYDEKTGTSMAAPNVAGSLLLLQQLYEESNGNNGTYMRSATLKGLAIHTAKDLGNPGPDFTYGWGLLNAKKAGDVVVRASYELDHRIFEENDPNGYSFTFFKDGPIRVTLCYTDVAGTPTSIHDDTTPKLVNDLDLTVVKTGGPTFYPYVMDTNNPSANATTGDNDLDNVEQIYLNNEPDGEYTVYVNVEGTLTGTQPFSLIISGVSDGCGGGDLDLGNNVVVPDVYYGNIVTCEGTVQSGDVVKFVGGNSVLLREDNGSGFHAVAGSNFKAVVLQCD